MCNPINKNVVEGYVLFTIQITVVLQGLLSYRPSICNSRGKSLLFPTSGTAASQWKLSPGLRRARCRALETCLHSCLPSTRPCKISSPVKVPGKHRQKGSLELRSLALGSSHSVSLLCLNHKASFLLPLQQAYYCVLYPLTLLLQVRHFTAA